MYMETGRCFSRSGTYKTDAASRQAALQPSMFTRPLYSRRFRNTKKPLMVTHRGPQSMASTSLFIFIKLRAKEIVRRLHENVEVRAKAETARQARG